MKQNRFQKTPATARASLAPGARGTPDCWIFDLDNTLYPPQCNLFAQIDIRMGRFISALLGVDADEARRIQKDYFIRYGTTLKGLMDIHQVAPEDYLDYVHDIDVSPVPPNPRLVRALGDLPGRKLVFTNGSVPHAERVLARLGIDGQIDDVFDIAAAGFVPKPVPETYDRLIETYDLRPGAAVMVEDMARNLAPAAALGMTTVWLNTAYEWGGVDMDETVIDHVIDDLEAWLEAQVAGPAVDDAGASGR